MMLTMRISTMEKPKQLPLKNNPSPPPPDWEESMEWTYSPELMSDIPMEMLAAAEAMENGVSLKAFLNGETVPDEEMPRPPTPENPPLSDDQ
jgi:hypothetical protein